MEASVGGKNSSSKSCPLLRHRSSSEWKSWPWNLMMVVFWLYVMTLGWRGQEIVSSWEEEILLGMSCHIFCIIWMGRGEFPEEHSKVSQTLYKQGDWNPDQCTSWWHGHKPRLEWKHLIPRVLCNCRNVSEMLVSRSDHVESVCSGKRANAILELGTFLYIGPAKTKHELVFITWDSLSGDNERERVSTTSLLTHTQEKPGRDKVLWV